MRNSFGDFALFEAILDAKREMRRELGSLTIGNERADRHEATVTRRKVRPQPEVLEQYIGRVLHHRGEHRAELIADVFYALRLGGLIEWKRCQVDLRKLIA